MSLDVYLKVDNFFMPKPNKIFIRENGQTKEITREEWDIQNPGREPVIFNSDTFDNTAYHANITHNLGRMAAAADIYECLWRPEEINIETAEQLIEPLTQGLNLLKNDPEKFKLFNPENGWGNYELLVSFVESYLSACIQYKNAKVSVCR